jgi:hypothetical protein
MPGLQVFLAGPGDLFFRFYWSGPLSVGAQILLVGMGMGMMPWGKVWLMLGVVGEVEVFMVICMVPDVLFLAILVLALLSAGMGPVVMRAWFGFVSRCHGKSIWSAEDMRLAVAGGKERPGRKCSSGIKGEYPTTTGERTGRRFRTKLSIAGLQCSTGKEKLLLLLFLRHLPDLVVDVGAVLHMMPFVMAHPEEKPAGRAPDPDLVLVGEFRLQG